MTAERIQIKQWVQRGSMSISTAQLPDDDPDAPYNQVVRAGGDPADYRLARNPVDELRNASRGELIDIIVDLRRQLRGARSGG